MKRLRSEIAKEKAKKRKRDELDLRVLHIAAEHPKGMVCCMNRGVNMRLQKRGHLKLVCLFGPLFQITKKGRLAVNA